MSFTELLDELPALTVAERQVLIRRALELTTTHRFRQSKKPW